MFPAIPVDPDSIISRHESGTILAVGPLRDEYPLYRQVRVLMPRPARGRRKFSYWCTWIVHQARFKRGGQDWRLMQEHPELAQWATAECAAILTPADAQESHGLSSSEWEALVAAEQAKYGA